MNTNATDAEVIQISNRTPEQFATVFDRHHEAVHAFAARRAGRDAADDVLSEVFLAAFAQRDRFDVSAQSALPWLYGIAGNVLKRRWRVACTDAADLYRQNPAAPADMLKALRELVRKSTVGLLPSDVDPQNNSDVWGTAFSLLWDPCTSDDVRANVLRALALMDGVQVVDKNAEIAGKTGAALGFGGDSLQLIFDRESDAFLGMRNYPERGPDWVGPSEPVWTLVSESKIVNSAPQPPR